MTTVATRPRWIEHKVGLLDPDVYRRSLHLVLDLPLGIFSFSLGAALLALSAGLMITLVGIPLLIGTLIMARLFGRLEVARAAALLRLHRRPAPPSPHGWRSRLTDGAGWRALAYALLLGPLGVVTGTLTLAGWMTALGAVAFPAYAWTLSDPALHLGRITVSGAPAGVGAVLCGLLLLGLMPAVTRLLARLDAVLVRVLLH